jgi:hypothetical protein
MSILSILLMVGGIPAAQASLSREELQTIEHFVLNEQWAALHRFIQEHPELLQGDGILAAELKEVNRCYEAGRLYLCDENLLASITDVLEIDEGASPLAINIY